MLKYSIVMPTYNTGERLRRSIDSVINQTYTNWELIIIDDGSTDNTKNILNRYSKLDCRLKVYTQKNQGPGVARNNGIKKCSGKYIAFIDSDDYYEEDFLEQVNAKNVEVEQDIIFVNGVNEYNNGKKCGEYNFQKYKYKDIDQILRLQIMGIIPWGGVFKVVKKEIAKKCLYSKIDVGEELLFSVKSLEIAKNISFVDNTLYHYVYNEKGQHTLGGLDPWNELCFMMKKEMIKSGEYYKYNQELNSLALKALSIALYRHSCVQKYSVARKNYKKIIKNYSDNFDIFDIRTKDLDYTTNIIAMLIKLRAYFIIYLASKLKKGKIGA